MNPTNTLLNAAILLTLSLRVGSGVFHGQLMEVDWADHYKERERQIALT